MVSPTVTISSRTSFDSVAALCSKWKLPTCFKAHQLTENLAIGACVVESMHMKSQILRLLVVIHVIGTGLPEEERVVDR